jgi:hypothetical protein
VLKNLRKKLGQSTEELHEQTLSDRYEAMGLEPIAGVPRRARVRIGGEVQGLQVVARAGSPSLEVTVSDGTGRAVAVFTGRRRLGGIDPGRTVLFEGVGRDERGRLLLVNPAYTLMP